MNLDLYYCPCKQCFILVVGAMFLWITSGSTQFVKGTFYMDFDFKKVFEEAENCWISFW